MLTAPFEGHRIPVEKLHSSNRILFKDYCNKHVVRIYKSSFTEPRDMRVTGKQFQLRSRIIKPTSPIFNKRSSKLLTTSPTFREKEIFPYFRSFVYCDVFSQPVISYSTMLLHIGSRSNREICFNISVKVLFSNQWQWLFMSWLESEAVLKVMSFDDLFDLLSVYICACVWGLPSVI